LMDANTRDSRHQCIKLKLRQHCKQTQTNMEHFSESFQAFFPINRRTACIIPGKSSNQFFL
jgi:hypothetical protein